MIIDESIVIVLATLVVVLALYKSIYRMMSTNINKHQNDIHDLIHNSYNEKDASATEHTNAIEKNKTIEGKIAQILNVARLEAKLITSKERKALETTINRKVSHEKVRLLRQHDLAVEELKERIINISTHYSYKLTTLKIHDKVTQKKVVNLAIEQIPSKLH